MEPLNIDTDSIHGVTVTIYFEKIIENQSRDQNDVSIIGRYTQNDKQFKRKDLEDDFNFSKMKTRTIVNKMLKANLIETKGIGRATYYSI